MKPFRAGPALTARSGGDPFRRFETRNFRVQVCERFLQDLPISWIRAVLEIVHHARARQHEVFFLPHLVDFSRTSPYRAVGRVFLSGGLNLGLNRFTFPASRHPLIVLPLRLSHHYLS